MSSASLFCLYVNWKKMHPRPEAQLGFQPWECGVTPCINQVLMFYILML